MGLTTLCVLRARDVLADDLCAHARIFQNWGLSEGEHVTRTQVVVFIFLLLALF